MKNFKPVAKLLLLILLLSFSFTTIINGQATTVTILQSNDTCAMSGDINVPVIIVKINVQPGSSDSLSSLTLSTAGSTDALVDIAQAKVFFTANSGTFSTANTIGTEASPSGVFYVVPATPVSLNSGDNYFWVAYDVSLTAITGDVLDAECLGAGLIIPVITAPQGNIVIGCSNRIESLSGAENVNIFPNPFINNLNLVTEKNETTEIVIFDIAYRILLQQEFISTVSLNTERLAKGIYYFEMRYKDEVYMRGKVVKE